VKKPTTEQIRNAPLSKQGVRDLGGKKPPRPVARNLQKFEVDVGYPGNNHGAILHVEASSLHEAIIIASDQCNQCVGDIEVLRVRRGRTLIWDAAYGGLL
jgi:hypothetical protein